MEQTLNVPLAASSASTLSQIVSRGVPVLLIVLVLFSLQGAEPLPLAFLILLTLFVVVQFWVAPRRLAYTLMPDAVVIQRVLNQTRLPYAGLSARRTSGVLSIRNFGTGQPGYLTGHFTLAHDEKGVGRVRAAASTARGGGVLLHSGDAHYFLTPADPQAFLAELARRGAGVAT